MSDTKVVIVPGVSFLGLLTLLFITLKLTGYIGWSWWWVLAPLWLPAAICFGLAALCFLAAAVLFAIGVTVALVAKRNKRKQR